MAQTTPTTQSFVPITSIKDNIITLENGQICAVLLTTSINLALKSFNEQKAILRRFQDFLNGLDFSIQIYVQSRRYDPRNYIEYLTSLENIQYNNLMKTQLYEYIQFIKAFTEDVAIMKKNFFVIIPYNPALITKKGSFIPKKFQTSSKNTTESREKIIEQLEQRVATVEQGLEGVGIQTARLDRDALIELYYHIFNPGEKGSAQRPKVT